MKYKSSFPLAVLLAAPLSAQSYRLNAPLLPGGSVRIFRVTPDGQHVVYFGYPGQFSSPPQEPPHLYLVDVRRPDTVRMIESRPCISLELAGERIVYLHWAGSGSVVTSMLLDGNDTPVDLTPPGPNGLCWPTPDGRTVVILRQNELYRVPADGSGPVEPLHLNPPGKPSHTLQVTPDGQRAVYVTEGSIDSHDGWGHLYSASLDGSSPPRSLTPASIAVDRFGVLVSPDSRWAVFRRLETTQGRGIGIYRVPLDGSAAAVPLHAPLPTGADVPPFLLQRTAPRFSADGSRVIYALEQEVAGLTELYSAPLDGSSPPVKLNDDAHRMVYLYRVSPDGSRVVFVASPTALGQPFGLFWTPVAGGAAPLRLDDPTVTTSALNLGIAPDNRTVAYVAESGQPPIYQLFVVSMDGTPHPRRLSWPSQNCPPVQDTIQFAHGSALVTYLAGQSQDRAQLFAAPTNGAFPARRLHGPLVGGGSVVDFDLDTDDGPRVRFAANDTLALFFADLEVDQRFELWAAPLFSPPRSGPRVR